MNPANPSETMKVMGADQYGPLEQLKLLEIPTPEPGPGEVRVRVVASALNPADYKVVLGTMKFLHARNFPMVVGYDFSGTVEALGPGVDQVKMGDEVFGFLPYAMANRRGAFAEKLVARVDELALKPSGVSHLQAAAAATAGISAIQSLRDLGRLPGSGSRVLITGISGGVGSLAIGIARQLGASVTALGSGKGLEMARLWGAESVVDRKSEDVFKAARGPFDVVFDAAASYRWSQWKASLKPGGVYVTTLPSLSFAVDKIASLFSRTGVQFLMVKSKSADLRLLGEWLANGLEVPVDSTLPVRDVAKGLERLKKGEVVGRIAVDVLNQFGGS
jgi:NADPH:quinone reductase-like Zn-dependent oxidoreductase